MTMPEPLTDAARVSDAERDRAIAVLREHSAEGRLSPDTFMRRIDLALRAQGRAELDALTADLPTRGRLAGLLERTVRAASGWGLRLQGAWQHPRLPSITLPQDDSAPLRIGRLPGCDLRLSHLSVSRVHAELRHEGEAWLLRDLGSTNGTSVNGSRIIGTAAVRPGDRIAFGHAHFRLAAR